MAPSPEEARPHVEKALRINPENKQAAAWLEKVEQGEREAQAAKVRSQAAAAEQRLAENQKPQMLQPPSKPTARSAG